MSTSLQHPPVVVGVDGSSTSDAALHWAIREAATRRIPLRLVCCHDPSYDVDALGLATGSAEAHCRAVLDAARDKVTNADPSVEVTTTTSIGPASTALVEASVHADTLVVGSRGLRAVPALLLGATSLQVAAHAACPVVVVRSTDPATHTGGVVVGVDGTPRTTEAIGYAFGYASAHDLELTVLHAFQVEYVSGVISAVAAEEANARLAQGELALTAEVVAGWREKFPDVRVTTLTMRDHPVDALVDASARASLLVIGGRRRRRGGVLLGSVGHGVLHDAHCPVAVVRAHEPVGPEHR